MRAVLDTNVLVSGVTGFAIPESVPGQILRGWRTGQFELVTSAHILAEFTKALARPYFRRRLTAGQIQAALELFASEAIVVSPQRPIPQVVSDPNDDLVLATAVAGDAAVLVTGDRELRELRAHRDVIIVSPRTFLTMLEDTEAKG